MSREPGALNSTLRTFETGIFSVIISKICVRLRCVRVLLNYRAISLTTPRGLIKRARFVICKFARVNNIRNTLSTPKISSVDPKQFTRVHFTRPVSRVRRISRALIGNV